MVVDDRSSQKETNACHLCQLGQLRCDGGERCMNCVKYNFACTYTASSAMGSVVHTSNREKSSDSCAGADVEDLKRRLQSAEASLQEIQSRQLAQPPLYVTVIRSMAKPLSPPHPDDSEFIDISHCFRALSLDDTSPDNGFQGKSSAAMLVKAAVTMKAGGENMESQMYFKSQTNTKPWLKPLIPSHNSFFSDGPPMRFLVSLYFSNVNPFIPVLHRPTFEECINRGLHKHNSSFESILFLVCALGSLYLSVPAVSSKDRLRLGWEWYNQVELCGQSLRQAPTLYDIQAYCLVVQFLICTSNPRFAWSIAGFGLTLAQDLGSHRHKPRAPTVTLEEDLEKRAFWILSFLDTQLSAALGRSGVLDQVEIDVTLPSECDDEHWQLWGLGLQPRGRPSTMAFFNCLVDLYRILHFVLRVFYTIHSNNARMQRIPDLAHFAMELDSALDQWLKTIPQHLIWSPDRPDGIFFDQSAALYCLHYYTQILIHRPFIPGVSSMMQSNARASEICTEAARACIGVANIHRRRRPHNPLLFSQSPVFTSAMVLILNKWGGTTELTKATDDSALIHESIDILKAQLERWPSSEFFIHVLERLVSLNENLTQQFDENR
ncbi:fungal-specific transcription factor domain-containing protein [Mycena capillaripes]|nr:fungal-specific transcription factor domain-containing protein [Mycena capillaripes]